jgi:predicted nucleotide-binding protein
MAKLKETKSVPQKKRSKVSQTEFPNQAIQASLRIARAIWDHFAGQGAAPHDVAMALDLSPTSGGWRNLCGSSIAYGLTDGGYAAPEIKLTDLGRRIVAPVEDGDDDAAKVAAILEPRIMREFFTKYDKAKFPREDICQNVLVGLGLPKERAQRASEILKENGSYVGVIRDTKTGPFVALASPVAHRTSDEGLEEVVNDGDGALETLQPGDPLTEKPNEQPKAPKEMAKRVFITHGKNRKILAQVKELVAYGKFDPVVAQENETSAKPVPKKVMEDMRTCQAAVIHVGSEGVLHDSNGNEISQINGNVLIEIGAAMALYPDKFILLVEEGVNLPSNLQGLYECRYDGDELNMTATMKLLKAFSSF